jgi:hypothetical protein
MQMINHGSEFETFIICLQYFISIYIDQTDEIESLFLNISQRSVDRVGEFSAREFSAQECSAHGIFSTMIVQHASSVEMQKLVTT